MKKYNVEFSYNIEVTAENEEQAKINAMEDFDTISPPTKEMNIKITEVKEVRKNEKN